MQAFEYCNPTKIVFGCGRVKEVGEIAKTFGNRVMFVSYDREMVDSIGLLHKALDPLLQKNLTICEYYGVKSNPSLNHAREGVKIAKEFKPDVLVALGGGSVIDECKCIAASVASGKDIWWLVEHPDVTDFPSLPVIAVCTIPATSSEMNNIGVISNDETHVKDGIEGQSVYPAVALLDPLLTLTIPMRQTANSVADICSYLLEGYISHQESFVPMVEMYDESFIKTQMLCMERLLKNPQDVDARAQLMWAATNSWNGFCVLGIGEYEALFHALGHTLSELFDTPHGASLAMVMPAALTYTAPRRIERYAQLSRNIFGVQEEDDKKAAKAAGQEMQKWLRHIGAPSTFTEGNIPLDRLDDIKARAYQNVHDYGYNAYTEEDVYAIIDLCV